MTNLEQSLTTITFVQHMMCVTAKLNIIRPISNNFLILEYSIGVWMIIFLNVFFEKDLSNLRYLRVTALVLPDTELLSRSEIPFFYFFLSFINKVI